MIVCWVLGDLVKIIYFVTSPTPQPVQFIAGGWCSVILDFVVLYQLLFVYPNDAGEQNMSEILDKKTITIPCDQIELYVIDCER